MKCPLKFKHWWIGKTEEYYRFRCGGISWNNCFSISLNIPDKPLTYSFHGYYWSIRKW